MLPKGSTLKSDLTCKLDQVAQGFVHACSEYHQGWGFHDWSEPLFQCLPTLTMISQPSTTYASLIIFLILHWIFSCMSQNHSMAEVGSNL